MAIEFDCPNCGQHYRLKEELAGKAAACKNCRQKITIPSTGSPSSSLDLEALAAAAFQDDVKEVDPSTKQIHVECDYCGNKWIEPLSRAGKNTLCPNPECRQRVKIPEPTDEGQYDWRQTRSKLPEGAKQNQAKLEGVQDAAETRIVTGDTLKKAGVLEEELEPRPLKQKVMFVLVPVLLLFGLVYGGMQLLRSRSDAREDRLMLDSQADFTASVEALPKEEVPVFTAIVQLAAGEHALRHDSREKLKEAREHFGKAQAALGSAASTPARNEVLAELTVAILGLGGTEQQARDQVRIRWTQESGLKTRPNERVFTVYEDLHNVLRLAQVPDQEYRSGLARRLTHELCRRGQPALAADLLPLLLFPTDSAEGKAIVALELYRAGESDLARRLAAELVNARATSPSAHTLYLKLKIDKAPMNVTPPAPTGPVPDGTRYAYCGLWTLEGNVAEAQALALRPGKPEEQLRALVLCATWAAEPDSIFDAAVTLLESNKNPKEVRFSPYSIIRLAQLAAKRGRFEQARQITEALTDESARAWANCEILRARLHGGKESKAEESWLALPEDPKKFRPGHAWGRLCLARHNARLSGNREVEVKAVNAWPTPIAPFGKAGVALGLQDRDQ